LTLSALGADPFAFRWRKGGVPLSDGPTNSGSTIFGSGTPNLRIADGSAADAGSYDCVVTNPCGSASSNAVDLSVIPSGTGDGNGDSAVNGLDIQGFINAISSGNTPSAGYCAYDMDRNGVVGSGDVSGFVSRLLGV